MEANRISMFPLLFLLQFFSQALAYTRPDKYFINCGSDKNVTDNDRDFVGDSSIYFSKHSIADKEDNTSSSTSPLYQTARIFHRPSSYKFRIDEDKVGYHLLRLHFFAFSSQTNLSGARFNVSVPEFLLLDNFSVENYTNSALVKEFYLNINSSSFQIDFWPLDMNVAFVNAIELFRLPDNFTQDEALHASSKGNASDYIGILSGALHTKYRLDVGGNSAINDSLWRTWEQDDQYATKGNKSSSTNKINYKGEDSAYVGLAATVYIAPDSVYQTARVMNPNSSLNPSTFNMSWVLHVKRNTTYLVRAHFCDFISQSAGLSSFDLYIYNNYSLPIQPGNLGQTSAPFYYDIVVDSDDSGNLTIKVGPDKELGIKNAFLNGLEVMEIIGAKGPPPIQEDKPNRLHLELALGFGGTFSLICIIVGLYLLLKFRKPKLIETLDWSPLPVKGGSHHSKWGSSHGSSVGNLNLELKMSFCEIQSATKNFDAKRIIGKGGFGNVYMGIFKNGMRVAVKRGEPGSGQGLPEFQTEIIVLSRIRHRHLVSLIGYCDERSEMVLVYEYMENGTLRDHLYTQGHSNLPSLSWKQRLEICIGAARGLNYLHKGAVGGIIHRDVKSTNILLDENYVAKVADFGLSRMGPLDQQPHVTTNVKGTFGYLDPEYFRSQQLTEKSDVYSFGVVLLEVLCGRSALDPTLPRDQVNLAEWGIFCKNKGTLEEIIDPSIKGQIDPNSLRKFSETVEKCLLDDSCERPTMADVLWDLEYSLQFQRGKGQRKPQEDASSGASASLELANLRHLPSLSTLGDSDVMPILKDDSAVNYVFSQLNVDGAR